MNMFFNEGIREESKQHVNINEGELRFFFGNKCTEM